MFSFGSSNSHNVVTGGILFFLLSLPELNRLTNKYIGHTESKCPSLYTRIFHSFLYMICIVFLMTQYAFMHAPWNRVLGIAILTGLLFFFLASPDLYAFTNSVVHFGSDSNCPTLTHILMHSVVFMIVVHFLMVHTI